MTIDKNMNSKQYGIFSSSGRRKTLIIILGTVALIVILFSYWHLDINKITTLIVFSHFT
jgi:hypothetical protein